MMDVTALANDTSDPLNAALCRANWTSGSEVGSGILCRYNNQQTQQVFLFYIFAYLSLLLVCTIGNVLNLVILTHSLRKWKTSARCYMLGTAVADLGVLWFGLPSCVDNIGLLYQLPFAKPGNLIHASLGLLKGCTAWFQAICLHCSDWMLMAFSWERLLIIISPFRFGPLQRVLTAWMIIATLFPVALPFGILQFAISYWYYSLDNKDQDDIVFLAHPPIWISRWSKIDNLAAVIVQLVTFILIFIPSVCLIVFLSRQHRSTISQMRLQQAQSSRSQPSLKQNDSRPETGTTVILLSSSALYLATRFPMVVKLCLFYLGAVQYDWTVEVVAGLITNIAIDAEFLEYKLILINCWNMGITTLANGTSAPLNAALCRANWTSRTEVGSGILCQYNKQQIQQVHLFYIFAYLSLLLLCTIGNVLSLVILMRSMRKWKTSARCYMLVTTVADLGVLWLGLPSCVDNIGVLYHLPFTKPGNAQKSIRILKGCTVWFQQVCMHCSDWMLVAFSWERLLIIINPFRFGPLQRVSTAWVIIAILFLVALPTGVFQFVISYLYYSFDHKDDLVYLTNPPSWIIRWSKIDGPATVIVQLVTFILILVPSLGLILFLSRQHRSTIGQMRLQQTQSSRSRSSLKRNDSRSETGTTIILLSSSALYLVTRFPVVVQSCLFYLGDRDIHYDWTVELVTAPFADIAMYAGYSFTFFTYLATTRNFREHLLKLVTTPVSKDSAYVRHS
ncbi:uncharacterized protein LOC129598731 [Paramacrobiotus metropolitanus]|uniref:uncharacterized protein LOC129598731 n=1 Tax=Paramacrobiotus metropolitanus TaxID=2943436 RepID=UPI0024464F1E|nr:uncharacterized protein LOC129598731 [Paramacrobiotus metropolitanus]